MAFGLSIPIFRCLLGLEFLFFVFGFLGQDGYVSIYVPEGYRLGIASSSPYRFPWFGAPFKKKSASQEDSYIKSLAGFSNALIKVCKVFRL